MPNDNQDEALKQFNATVQRFEKFLSILRNELHWQAFRFNTGSSERCYIQKQHCFVDGLHNPNGVDVTVTLSEDGVNFFNDTLAPGYTSPPIKMPFMRECVIVTDGLPVTIWGRIRS